MKVVLELQDQPSNIRKITVRHDIVIGRGSDCNLRLSAPQISRRHCFLRVSRDSASVTDLDSSNGTYLNGKRVQSGKRYELTDGSSLALGPIRFLVQVRPDVVAAEILNEADQVVNDSINTSPNRRDRSGSTVVDAAQAMGRFPSPADVSVHEAFFSVEHAGDSADSHDATADFDPAGNVNIRPPEEFPLNPQASSPESATIPDCDQVPPGLQADLSFLKSAADRKESAHTLDGQLMRPTFPQINDGSSADDVVELSEADLLDSADDRNAVELDDPEVLDDVELLDEDSPEEPDGDWFHDPPSPDRR